MRSPSSPCCRSCWRETRTFGSLCQWLINVLNIVTGNLDREGGALFTLPAFDLIGGPRAFGVGPGSHGRWKSRVRGLPESSGELHVAALAGYGHQRPGIRQQVASAHAGASINDLTDAQALDVVSGNAAFSGTPVQLRPA
ncbi:hypothetical protein [Corallococcus sp. RDP092CA]|uniref:hypothetical protein n=1 Tax=Corallococcus sp. RDP092CA TaxID=3109369 RepID=UPI0035B49EE3